VPTAPDPTRLIDDLDRELAATGDPDRAVQEKRYLKSDLHFHGHTLPAVRRRAQALRATKPYTDAAGLRALVDVAWARPSHDLHLLSVLLLELDRKLLGPDDLPWLQGLVRTSFTWAYVDSLAAWPLGDVVRRHPQTRAALRQWARDDDVWVRRAAVLAELVELRQGRGDFAHFETLVTPLLVERSFWIRKAIGWVLRDMSKLRPELVRGFVERHGAQMAPLTLREATRKLADVEGG
jgi:3-methyladenine DNA glycosylase AlkD